MLNPPSEPLLDLIIFAFVSCCKILAVKASGVLISSTIFFKLTRFPFADCVAMYKVALIPYSQVFEKIYLVFMGKI